MGQQVNVYRELKMFPGAIVSGALGPLYDPNNLTYYVNNITGNASADGLSWNSAVLQIDEAITLQAAHLALNKANNRFVRDRIIIQGTATAYDSFSTMPQYCDIVGLGADPYGSGDGIARFTSSSGNTSEGSTRGTNWYNLQFTAPYNATGDYAMDLAVIFRSSFEHCVFGNKGTAAMRIVTGGGIIINDCLFGGDTNDTTYGLYIGSDATSGNFNACKVSNSTFHGTTAALYNSGYYQNQTVFTNNVFMGGTNGLYDNSRHSGGVQYLAFYVHNHAYGTYSTVLNESGVKINILPYDRSIGNLSNDHGTVRWHPSIA